MGPDDAFWEDGEWVSWDEIHQQIQYKEWRAKWPNADLSLVPVFEDLISVAEDYFLATGRHLQVYGDIGELYAAITYGIRLHKNFAQGSDGRLGNDHIEVKTIAPMNTKDQTSVKLSGHFNKLLVVNISEEFEISSRMIDRASLPKTSGNILKIRWDDLA
ncbi:DUF6998 domain-containing protein [Emcibacter nanhaiensis]|uniref:DUF6998 domain-containing protein n=1 Tax=Emcibacter nanhaiensis TaxID=1505037 RepID=A0A501PC55_9PROT|nr:hypothetical protein [Emcibacter nanhaiensis]TPD57556.1 hypothetical protein FIV46_15695 [Emcibacter nanhaiensis]